MITEALIQANIKDCLTYIHIVFFASYIQSSLVFIVRGSFRPKPFEAPRVNAVFNSNRGTVRQMLTGFRLFLLRFWPGVFLSVHREIQSGLTQL